MYGNKMVMQLSLNKEDKRDDKLLWRVNLVLNVILSKYDDDHGK